VIAPTRAAGACLGNTHGMDLDSLTRRSGRAFRVASASLGAFWALIAASILAGVTIASEPYWWRPSLSHFGAQGAQSELVYDGLQVAASVALLALAIALPRACEPLEGAGRLRRWQRLGLGGVIVLLAASLATLALLPYNLGGQFGWPVYVIHNVAGWVEAIVPAASMMLLPWTLPVFSRRFYAFTWACLLPLVAVWFLFVIARILAHGLSELIAYGVLGVWSFAFLAELAHVVRRDTTADAFEFGIRRDLGI